MAPLLRLGLFGRRRFLSGAACALGLGPAALWAEAGQDAAQEEQAPLATPALLPEPGHAVRLAGRSLLVGFVGTEADDAGTRTLLGQIAAGEVGGVLLLGRNIVSAAQLAELTGALGEVAGEDPLVVAIDNEGGAVLRTEGRPGFTDWMAARDVPEALGTSEAARAYYRERALELRRAGITLNLAPVLDLDVNPASPAIGRIGRSFSADPAEVVRFARALVEGHHDAGVACCGKHVPGHGSAVRDSHDGLADVTATWTEEEMAPFAALAREGGVDALMMGHLVHASLIGNRRTPASLSRRAVAEVRLGLGFEGAIVTDDLHMEAIAQGHTDEEATVAALQAGNDAVLVSNAEREEPDLGHRLNAALVRALRDGRLDEERLAEAGRRMGALGRRASAR